MIGNRSLGLLIALLYDEYASPLTKTIAPCVSLSATLYRSRSVKVEFSGHWLAAVLLPCLAYPVFPPMAPRLVPLRQSVL